MQTQLDQLKTNNMNLERINEMYIKLATEIEKLRAAIRKHRDQRGDDRCWLDDEELYKALPEGYTPPARDSCVELKLCQKYIESRHNPSTIYVSPQREIERLRDKYHKLLLELNNDCQLEICPCRGDMEDCIHCQGKGFTMPTCAWCGRSGTVLNPLTGPNILLHKGCIDSWVGSK